MLWCQSTVRRAICLAVGLLFALSASLYAATVSAPDIERDSPPALAAGSDQSGGCHGDGGNGRSPAHPATKTACCDIACHAWLPPELIAFPMPPPAATQPMKAIAVLHARPVAGIDRPPRP